MDWKKALLQPKIVLLLVASGALMVIGNWGHLPSPSQPSQPASAPAADTSRDPTDTTISDYEKYCEKRLTAMLNQMQGISDVSVLVNVDSTEEVTYATGGNTSKSTTTETDKNGGNRSTTQASDNTSVIMMRGSNGDVPVVVSKKKPPITAVWVEAHGVSDLPARSRVESAIVRFLNIPAHRISITEKQ